LKRLRKLLLSILKDHDDFLRRHHLLFPLARSLDAMGRYDEAYATLEEAHRSQVAFLETAAVRRATEGSPRRSSVRPRSDIVERRSEKKALAMRWVESSCYSRNLI